MGAALLIQVGTWPGTERTHPGLPVFLGKALIKGAGRAGAAGSVGTAGWPHPNPHSRPEQGEQSRAGKAGASDRE